jgi:hypothetical protein
MIATQFKPNVARPYANVRADETALDIPLHLDGVIFVGNASLHEAAFHPDGDCKGEIGINDEFKCWQARKGDSAGDFGPWHPMRCRAEARAYIVSRYSVPARVYQR